MTNIINRSLCSKCGKVAPAKHEERDGKVYLVKDCPTCGRNEALVSSDAPRYHQKRDMCGYRGEAETTCALNCTTCNHPKKPTLVFLDVTNRCNMNCPICLANIPAMGFQFDPPLAYFEKVFKTLGAMNPRPKIQLFGGEPTVRTDLIDIIKMAKSYGLQARVVTNGLKLADAEYCKQLLATGTQLMFAFDGRSPEIYQKIRKSTRSYEKKLLALENVRKYRKSKITIMCCTGIGVNEEHLNDLVQFCHDGRDYIAALDLIPLTATWGPEEVEAVNTTMEDVEHIMAAAVPGMEFVPAGMLMRIKTILEVFNIKRVTFGGAHPNCECVSLLISDGKGYSPASRYLKKSFTEVICEAARIDAELEAKLKTSLLAHLLGNVGKKMLAASALFGLARRSINFREVFGGSVIGSLASILWGLACGRKAKNLLRKYTQCQGILRVIILPFEETACVESARLVECPTSFAYEHPETGEIRLMPVCSWPIWKNDFLREIAKRYGISDKEEVFANGSLQETGTP